MSHPDDETLSALLDGEAVDASAVAHVATCPTCTARLDAFRHVSATLAIAPVPAAHLREASVTSALVETSGLGGGIRRLATARRARTTAVTRTARRTSAASAAAALLVALGVGGWLVSQSHTTAATQRSTTFSQANTARRPASAHPSQALRPANQQAVEGSLSGATGAASAAGNVTGASRQVAFYDAGAIGAYTQLSDVAARAKSDLDTRARNGGADHTATESPCPTPADETIQWHATLTYRGLPAYARVMQATNSARTLEVLDQAHCALVESQTI